MTRLTATRQQHDGRGTGVAPRVTGERDARMAGEGNGLMGRDHWGFRMGCAVSL
jgi:hypothetical protein